ncbi:MAG: efflux RND transporter periplasmic adaptor subunit [Anaerolineae bacterium]
MKRTLIIALILLVVVGGGVASYLLITPDTYSVAEDPTIETLVIKTDTIVATVSGSARLEAIETADLSFEASGTVAKIYVTEGARVEAGTLLAELDTTDLSRAVQLAEIDLARANAQLQKLLEPPAQTDIDAAQAALDSARAGLEQLAAGPSEADVNAAQAALDSARANLQRLLNGPNTDSITVAAAGLRKAEIALRQAQDAYNQVAFDSRSASFQGAALEQATIDYQTAQANYNLAVKQAENADILAAHSQIAGAEANLQKLLDGPDAAQIAAAQAQIAQAEASLQKLLQGPSEADIAVARAAVQSAELNLDQARRNLEHVRLFSPIAGTVTAVNIKQNERPAAPVAVSVADLSTFKLEVEIDEIDINQITTGQPVIITLDSLPDEEYAGVVDRIAVALVVGASGGIVAYPVTVLVNSADAPFKVGMNVNVTIETERLEDIVVVENRAVQIDRETGQAYVDKIENDQTLARTEITLGRRGNNISQVLSGLQAGDTIAIQQGSRREQLRQAIGGGPNN